MPEDCFAWRRSARLLAVWAILAALASVSGWAARSHAATGLTVLQSAASGDSWALCARAINRGERELGIPRRLLHAISLVESGRWNERARTTKAWPWTVMAEGRGRYLPSKAAAVAEVRRLQANGVQNIDVGCMQINLRHHPNAFDSLDEAFDPAVNVSYGARFLRSLQLKHRSWVKAVGNYHSATPARHRVYRAKVLRTWQDERRAPFEVAAGTAAKPLAELDFGRAGPVAPGEASW